MCIITNHVTADVFPVEHISFWPCYSVCSLGSVKSNNHYTMRFLLQMRLQTLLWCIGSVMTLLLLIQLLILVCVGVCVYIFAFVSGNPVYAVGKMYKKQHTLLL